MSAAALALVSGYAADRLLGDPARFHPVAGFGRIGTALERRLWRPEENGLLLDALRELLA